MTVRPESGYSKRVLTAPAESSCEFGSHTGIDDLRQRRRGSENCRNARGAYRWDSKLQKDEEVLLLIKTTQDRYETVEKAILQRTSYELPDILAVPVNTGFPDYLNWLAASVRPEK
jgi:periplasmic divalent cation tolerance protein